MAQELELSEYATIKDLQGTKTNCCSTELSDGTSKERRLIMSMLAVGVLCIVLATVSISLRIASGSKEDTYQFPFNSSTADVCQIDQSRKNSTQSCSCYMEQVKNLLSEIQQLKRERDTLSKELNAARTREDSDSIGSGFGEEIPTLDIGRLS